MLIVHHVGTFTFLVSDLNAVIASHNIGAAINQMKCSRRQKKARPVNCEALYHDVAVFRMTSQFYVWMDVLVTIYSAIPCRPNHYFLQAFVLKRLHTPVLHRYNAKVIATQNILFS